MAIPWNNLKKLRCIIGVLIQEVRTLDSHFESNELKLVSTRQRAAIYVADDHIS